MKRRITKLPQAKRDLVYIFAFIGEHNLPSARRFLKAVSVDVARLAQFPGLGVERHWSLSSLAGLRTLPVSGFRNYLLIYRATDDQLELVRVVHGARNFDQLLGP